MESHLIKNVGRDGYGVRKPIFGDLAIIILHFLELFEVSRDLKMSYIETQVGPPLPATNAHVDEFSVRRVLEALSFRVTS